MSPASQAAETAEPLFANTAWYQDPAGAKGGDLAAQTHYGLQSRYLVLRKKRLKQTTWVALRLPQRPNNAVGWVPLPRLYLRQTTSKLYISLAKRELSFFAGSDRLWSTKVVIGKPSTPTPRGNFALWDRYRDDYDMRPWVFATTAHSGVLYSFDGADARIALHGRHGSLWAPWGSASSNGCIRTPDWALRFIRKHAPLGSPLQIR